MGEIKKDRTLICGECGREFLFTVEEQKFYEEKGFTRPPRRCKDCRRARRSAQTYAGVCAACGKEARVPFPPREDRLVYCGDCFAQMRAERKKR